MAVAKNVIIAKFTGAGDTIVTAEKITFNNQSEPDFKAYDKIGAYMTSLKVVEPEGLGVNQAAEKPDGNIQALGVTEKTWILTGFITRTDGNDGSGLTNTFLNLLQQWKAGEQILKDVWEAGRFAIQDSNDVTNNLTPIGTGSTSIGLIFKNYEKTYDPIKNRTDIILTFRRSRGPDI